MFLELSLDSRDSDVARLQKGRGRSIAWLWARQHS